MKFPILVLTALIFFFGCNNEDDDQIQLRTGCIPANLQNGIIAYYPFNNGDLLDASSNGNDLSNPTTAVPTLDRNGNPNCAFEFNNTTNTEFLTTTNTGFLNGLSAFSIVLWYQPLDTIRDGGKYEVLVGRGEDAAHCPDRRGEWSVGRYDCGRAVFGHNNSVWADRVFPDLSCQDEVVGLANTWQHVVAIYNNDTYKIYYNGVLNDSETGVANCSSTLHLAEDMGDLFIGELFTGSIDEVLIYKRELSAAEVTELWELEACCE